MYLGVLLLFDVVYPRRKLTEAGPGTLWDVLLGIMLAVFTYDLFFFPLHVCMHRVGFLRRLHVEHHTTKALYSTEVLRHSLLDGSLQVATNVAVLNLLRLHPFTRMCYNVVITGMLTEIHSGFDFPWSLHNVVPLGLLGGPPRHEEHHRSGRRNFQQFFTLLDDFVLPKLLPQLAQGPPPP